MSSFLGGAHNPGNDEKAKTDSVFLVVGLVQLNVFLFVSAWFPATPIATFVSALMVLIP
jgi:hypothetical protein